MWYSLFDVASAAESNTRTGAFYVVGDGSSLSDFGILGNETSRDSGGENGARAGIDIAQAQECQINRLFITHSRVGIWVTGDIRTKVAVDGMVIRNMYADGINFANGTSNSSITNCHISTTGDEGIALLSDTGVCTNNRVKDNWVELVYLGCGINILGGKNNRIEGNIIKDITSYSLSGISINTGYKPFDGETVLRDNTLMRAGGVAYGDEHASIRIEGPQALTGTVKFINTTIIDAPFSGIVIRNNTQNNFLVFDTITAKGENSSIISIRAEAEGSAKFENCFNLTVKRLNNDRYILHWSVSPDTCAITFDAGGGSVTPASGQTGTDGKLATLPAPAWKGCLFDGWYTAATGGTQVTTATVFEADTTIYARWTELIPSKDEGVDVKVVVKTLPAVQVTIAIFFNGTVIYQGTFPKA